MNLFPLPFLPPAQQLASDEALLESAEAGEGGEVMLFWEPVETFVVVGYANKVITEVNVPECEKHGIPIFRRCSGGGTVVQLPGGLNYSLILRITENGPTRDITSANQFIMDRNRAALQAALGRPLRLLGFGSAAGLILGLLATKVLSFIVYQATPRDPFVLLGVVLAMLLLGLLATWIPARRALSINPMILLREE